MNKFQKAYYGLVYRYYGLLERLDDEDLTDEDIENVNTINELVDMSKPKLPAFDKTWEDEETKDIYDENGYINEVVCECPNCHKRTIFDFEYGVRFKHCHECGQKILWEDK